MDEQHGQTEQEARQRTESGENAPQVQEEQTEETAGMQERFDRIKIQFQEPVILEGTLRENLALGDPFADEEIEQALRLVMLDGFAREHGLDYAIHESGKNCSDHSSIDGNSSLSQIKNAQKIIFITVPREDHIVCPGTDDRYDDGINNQICISVRILSSSFCLTLCQV